MQRSSLSRLAAMATLVLAALVPANVAQIRHVHAAGITVTMYAGPSLTPYGGPINQQHMHAVTALKVLAQQFEKQTGIQIRFANPAIGSASGNTYPDWNRYMQASIAGGMSSGSSSCWAFLASCRASRRSSS